MCGWSRGAEEIVVRDEVPEVEGSLLTGDRPLLEKELPGN